MALTGYILTGGFAVVLAVTFYVLRRRIWKEHKVSWKVTITGNAVYIKGQPAVIAETGGYGAYFIKGMKTWEQGWLYQRIRIIGELEINTAEDRKYILDAAIQKLKEENLFSI